MQKRIQAVYLANYFSEFFCYPLWINLGTLNLVYRWTSNSPATYGGLQIYFDWLIDWLTDWLTVVTFIPHCTPRNIDYPLLKFWTPACFFWNGWGYSISNFVPINKLFVDTVFASGSKFKKIHPKSAIPHPPVLHSRSRVTFLLFFGLATCGRRQSWFLTVFGRTLN